MKNEYLMELKDILNIIFSKSNVLLVFYVIYITLITTLFIFVLFIYNSTRYYTYINSVEINDYRYSLYKNFSWEVHQILIFNHKKNYQNYNYVEKSKVSLNILNGNKHDIYLYDIYLDSETQNNPKINLIGTRYLILSNNEKVYFIFDTYENNIVYEARLSEEGITDIENYIN